MKSERGNIVVYLLVSLVLFGVLLTGMWWVKRQAPHTAVRAPQTTQTTPQTPQTETKISQDDAAPVEPARNTPAAETPAPQTGTTPPSSNGGGETSSTSTTTPHQATPRPESQTPHVSASDPRNVASSGPVEDSIVSSTILGGIVYAGVLFARSRQAA